MVWGVYPPAGYSLELFVLLAPPQDVDTGHIGQIEVKQNQQCPALLVKAGAIAAEQVIYRSRTVGEWHDVIVDAGAADVSLDQTGVPLVVLDHDDGDWLAHEILFPVLSAQLMGNVIVKVLPQ